MRPAKPERSLARRLAAVSIGAAMIASAASVAVTTGLAYRAVKREERASMVGAANLLATEVEESPPADELAEEIRELSVRGMRALIVLDDTEIGDATIAARPERGCADVDADEPYRVCTSDRTLAPGERVWIAGPERADAYRGPFLAAAGVALLLALILAALGGGAAARWAALPLSRLRRALLVGDVAEPSTVRLPPPSGIAEVDAVSGAIETLLSRLDAELSRARRFASDAAHELRTPLTKILGELELLQEEPPAPDVFESELSRFHDRVAAMAALVERLLALATPASGPVDELVSLIDVVEDLAEQRDRERLTLELPEDDALVRGDHALLASLIRNGVDNALKFSTGPVSVRVLSRGERLVVQIDDEGPGVAPELRERVFEHFYRDPSARARAGHGLGLALVAHIAKVHGGSAAFVDGAEGARLEIELPRFQSAEK